MKNNLFLSEMLPQWLQWQRIFAGCRPASISYYNDKIKCFIRYSGYDNIDIFEDIEKFENAMMRIYSSPLAHNTKSKILACMRLFGNYLLKKKFIQINVSREIGKTKIQKQITIPLEEDEVSKIYRVINIRWSGELQLRNRLIFDLFLYAGIRHGELLNLKTSDIYIDRIVVLNGKGGKDRIVGIPRTLGEDLQVWIKIRATTSEYVFPGRNGKGTIRFVSAIFSSIRRASNIHVYPHLLRHTYASNCILHGMDIYTLQQQLGHCSIKVTAGYLYIRSEKRIQEVQKTVNYVQNNLQKNILKLAF